MTNVPKWMRAALWATAVMNLLGAVTFVPQITLGREMMGLPAAGHPLYLWIIAEFIFVFGVAYGWCAWTARAPRVFVAVAAAGKLAFFVTMAACWLAGDLPMKAALGASGDLLFGSLFVCWLVQTQAKTV
ncbi:MAG: hypothetical protein JNJ50_08700 [Acidobacteria bacterium]|nr:hypothetical protein [Acidobacteriota bacterium]